MAASAFNMITGRGGQFNFARGIEGHTDYVIWMLKTLRGAGAAGPLYFDVATG